MHAVRQNLNTEEEVENVADIGFDCNMCRPYMPASNVPSSDCCGSSLVAQIVTKVKELDPPKTYTQDGVCLTESGMTQLQSLTVAVPRRKLSKPKLKLKIINQNSVAILQTPPDIQSEHSRDGDMDDSREGELMDCDGKSESSPEREAVDDETKGVEGTDGVKKRKRKPYRPGIGGFMVRQRSRTGQGKTKRSVIRKDSSGSVSEQLPCRDDGIGFGPRAPPLAQAHLAEEGAAGTGPGSVPAHTLAGQPHPPAGYLSRLLPRRAPARLSRMAGGGVRGTGCGEGGTARACAGVAEQELVVRALAARSRPGGGVCGSGRSRGAPMLVTWALGRGRGGAGAAVQGRGRGRRGRSRQGAGRLRAAGPREGATAATSTLSDPTVTQRRTRCAPAALGTPGAYT
nr:histone-lysine N-methyltransferase 2C-like [Gorilla gorilla gorilla]